MGDSLDGIQLSSDQIEPITQIICENKATLYRTRIRKSLDKLRNSEEEKDVSGNRFV
jgi:hypothetical protein